MATKKLRIKGLLLRLTGDATVACAESICQEARRLARMRQDVRVDGSDVRKLDVSVLQILLALNRSLSEHGHSLVITGMSEVMRSMVLQAGLTEVLTCGDIAGDDASCAGSLWTEHEAMAVGEATDEFASGNRLGAAIVSRA